MARLSEEGDSETLADVALEASDPALREQARAGLAGRKGALAIVIERYLNAATVPEPVVGELAGLFAFASRTERRAVIDGLIGALARAEHRLRSAAVLAQLRDPAATAGLIEMLEDPDAAARAAAAAALERMQDPRAAAALLIAAEDPDEEVRSAARAALSRLGRAATFGFASERTGGPPPNLVPAPPVARTPRRPPTPPAAAPAVVATPEPAVAPEPVVMPEPAVTPAVVGAPVATSRRRRRRLVALVLAGAVGGIFMVARSGGEPTDALRETATATATAAAAEDLQAGLREARLRADLARQRELAAASRAETVTVAAALLLEERLAARSRTSVAPGPALPAATATPASTPPPVAPAPAPAEPPATEEPEPVPRPAEPTLPRPSRRRHRRPSRRQR